MEITIVRVADYKLMDYMQEWYVTNKIVKGCYWKNVR